MLENLSQATFFQELEPAVLERLSDTGVKKNLPREAFHSRDYVYVILAGHVAEAHYSEGGTKIITWDYWPGDCLGLFPINYENPEPFEPSATTSVTVLKRHIMLTMLAGNQAFMKAVFDRACHLVEETNRRLYEFQTIPKEQRVWRYIYRNRQPRDENTVLTLPFGQEGVAWRVGGCRETVNKAIRVLTEADIVENQGNRLLILDCERLAEKAAL